MENTNVATTTVNTNSKSAVTVSMVKGAFDQYVGEVARAVGGKDEESGQVTRPHFHGFFVTKGVQAIFKSAYDLLTEVGDLEGSLKKIRTARQVLINCQHSYAGKEGLVLLDRLIGGLRCEGDLRTKVNETREKYVEMLKKRHTLSELSTQFWLVHDTVVEADREQTERVARRDAEAKAERDARRLARRQAQEEASRKGAEVVNRQHRVNVAHTIMDQLSKVMGGRSAVV